MTDSPPRLEPAAIKQVKAEHSLVGVLARMGVAPPRNWDGRSNFRIPAAVLGFPYGRDDSQGVLVKPTEGRWWAFHGGFGGDVLELVRRVTGTRSLWKIAKILDSQEPIVVVGERVQVPAEDAVVTSEQPDLGRTSVERVRKANAAAWRYATLPKLAERARAYLNRRGIDVTALEAEVVCPLAGYTPLSRTGLVDRLRQKGFKDDEIVDSGWGVRLPGQALRDRFHDRVLLPFRSELGFVIGVTGRSVNWRPGDSFPKYLNHPRTVAFDKSAVLYRPSTPDLAEHATVIACEGTLDALAIAAAAARVGASGKFAPCSQSGISLTDQAARRLFALHHRPPVLCGDGDGAGQEATERWVGKAIRDYHREVLTLTLPGGMDPAEWLAREGDLGLVAFTRQGCLDDEENVRPKPAGALLARRELDRAMGTAPRSDSAVTTVVLAPAVIEWLGARAADLPGDAARQRFAEAAGAELASRVDGGSADQRTSQVQAAIRREIEKREGAGAAYDQPAGPVAHRWSPPV